MIDLSVVQPVLAKYKANFAKSWPKERRLWEAVKIFQDNWNLEASDFSAMFNASMVRAIKWFYGKIDYPLNIILEFAKVDEQAVRSMFRELYEESQDLHVRMEAFKRAASELRSKCSADSRRYHFQSYSVISTYLWLKYPDKYFIYAYDVYAWVTKALDFEVPQRDGSWETFRQGYLVYENLCEVLREDREFNDILGYALTTRCHQDTSLRTAALHFGGFLAETLKAENEQRLGYRWLHSDYSPNLSPEDWASLLNDPRVFNFRSLQIMRRMLAIGGDFTWEQLAREYGASAKFYEDGSATLAMRVQAKTQCPLISKDEPVSQWLLVLFEVRADNSTGRHTWVWRLRQELELALSLMDLPVTLLERTPTVWKIGFHVPKKSDKLGQMQRNLLQQRIVALECKDSDADHAFRDDVNSGDFFFLCEGDKVRLLGQFNGEVQENSDSKGNRWLERGFAEVGQTVSETPYDGHPYWWSPLSRSVCWKVPEEQCDDLMRLILYPYFGKEITDLLDYAQAPVKETVTADSPSQNERGYWTIIAAKDSCCCQLPVGAERRVRVLDERGRPHRISGNFSRVKVGDPVMLVHSGWGVVAMAKVTKACDGEEFRIAKVEQLDNPVTIADLDADPILADREGRHQLGTLFILTKDEYNAMYRLVQKRKEEYQRRVGQKANAQGTGEQAGESCECHHHGAPPEASNVHDQERAEQSQARGVQNQARGTQRQARDTQNQSWETQSPVRGAQNQTWETQSPVRGAQNQTWEAQNQAQDTRSQIGANQDQARAGREPHPAAEEQALGQGQPLGRSRALRRYADGDEGNMHAGNIYVGEDYWYVGEDYDYASEGYGGVGAGARRAEEERSEEFSTYERTGAAGNDRGYGLSDKIGDGRPGDAENEAYTKEDFLSEVFMDEASFDDLARLVKKRKNVVLYGVPGVGKSFVARRLAYAMMGARDPVRGRAVQFHRNFTYEEFVVGYRAQSDGSMARYVGSFLRFCQRASQDKQRDYFFVIDEINRGNVGDIMGELITALEPERRGVRMKLAGPQGRGMAFTVPQNVYVIGTLSTGDRGLVLPDRVVRRRFAFYELEPAFEKESFVEYQRELNNARYDRLVKVVTELNRAIEADATLGKWCRLGHSCLCVASKEECTTDWMRAVVDYEIVPVLEELWRNEPTMLWTWRERLEKAVH